MGKPWLALSCLLTLTFAVSSCSAAQNTPPPGASAETPDASKSVGTDQLGAPDLSGTPHAIADPSIISWDAVALYGFDRCLSQGDLWLGGTQGPGRAEVPGAADGIAHQVQADHAFHLHLDYQLAQPLAIGPDQAAYLKVPFACYSEDSAISSSGTQEQFDTGFLILGADNNGDLVQVGAITGSEPNSNFDPKAAAGTHGGIEEFVEQTPGTFLATESFITDTDTTGAATGIGWSTWGWDEENNQVLRLDHGIGEYGIDATAEPGASHAVEPSKYLTSDVNGLGLDYYAFRTPAGLHNCVITPFGENEASAAVVCIMGFDDGVVPEDSGGLQVPYLDAGGGQLLVLNDSAYMAMNAETILNYGSSITAHGITCGVEQTGITCQAGEHGLFASSSSYQFN